MENICIVAPGMLEVPTNRGGGREEQHYRIGIELSKHLNVTLISPFYAIYQKSIVINDRFTIKEVYFPALKEYPPKPSLEYYLIPLTAILYSILVSIRIINLIKKGMKIIIVIDILTGLLPALIANIFRVKVVFSEGNLTPWVNPHIVPKNMSVGRKVFLSTQILVGKLLCKLSFRIRTQSNLIKKGMMKYGICRNKIEVIRRGTVLDNDSYKSYKFFNKNYLFNKNFKVGFIGRLKDTKGVPLLLEICKKTEKVLPELRFIIIGGGFYEKHFKLLKNVERVGWVPRNMVPQLLSQVSAVLFFQKDLGHAEVESMAFGKAIIACNAGELPIIIKHLKNGMLCEPEADNYISAIRILKNDPNLFKRISKNARKTAINYFDWKVIGMHWLSLMKTTGCE